jgi:DnaJ-class molecular chaperone
VTPPLPDHYATLGLDRRCTLAQIRAAYRLLAKRYHPDVNPGCAESAERAQELNAAHETLSDPARRRTYDRELDARSRAEAPGSSPKLERNIRQDAHLRIEDFFRGATLEVRVKDPANPGPEAYTLTVPPDTAPGASFRIPRTGPFAGGFVQVRVKPLPGFRFKARGSDLRCDLRISAERAAKGGTETIASPCGRPLAIVIPARVARGEVLRLRHEGLPKARGGRGDLLIRLTYRPEVRVIRR